MTTIPHSDPDNGYAIRISKNLPEDAANLAYVHVDKPSPSKNISLKDYSRNIQENKITHNEEHILSYLNQEGFLEVDESIFESNTPNLLITDEYANNTEQTPLFFKYRSDYPIQPDNIEVSVPLSGNRLSDPKFLSNYEEGKESRYVYEGDKVVLLRSENTPLMEEDVFKVTLEKEDDEYYLVIYSAQELLDSGYEVHYPAIVDGRRKNQKEVMNLSKVFYREKYRTKYTSSNNYEVIENENNTFSVKIDTEATNFLITEEHREPYQFKYQLQTKVKTRLGSKNPYQANIGIIYFNENIFGAITTTSALMRIVNNNPHMPSFLTFDNPHRRSEGVHEKTNAEYWESSINMPLEHWLDYDIILISGYGLFDMSRYNENLRTYLSYGGIVMIETAGSGSQTLELRNNEIVGVEYSKEDTEEGARDLLKDGLDDRYYDLNNSANLGSIAPVIRFTGDESENDWEPFIKHLSGSHSLTRKRTQGPGQIIYSNLGILKDIIFNDIDSIKFFINFLLVILEEKSFVTPVYNEFVYHKDDLYPEEYIKDSGEILYVNEKSDEDATQIVAKKIIQDDIKDKVLPFIPEAYRNWTSLEIQTRLFDNEVIRIENNRFSLEGDTDTFNSTTVDAIPGFRYVSYSGEQGVGRHLLSSGQNSPSHIQVETTNTQAFFEQEIGNLKPGFYEFSVRARTTETDSGGFAVYDVLGELVAEREITGTFGWRTYRLSFELKEEQTVYLRLGAYREPADTNIQFSEVHLESQGVIRMTGVSNGGDSLYAYATSPKGKNNQLVAYEQTYSDPKIIKENNEIHAILRVKSFVYRWITEEGANRKEYGNEKSTEVIINTKDKEVVLGNVLEFTPPLYSGVQWSRKQNVFYEFELEGTNFVNIAIYDPTVDSYFFSPNGEWILNHEDIWWNGSESTLQVRLTTDYYHLVATDSQFTIGYEPNRDIRVMMPFTEDERNRWHLRVQNGAFRKEGINASELKELKDLGKEDTYDTHLIGEHIYNLPEYENQTFYPYFGEKMIDSELAVYVNPFKIEVQNTPMVITELSIKEERLTPSIDQTVWMSQNIFWGPETLPKIYLDQHGDGTLILLNSGFEIDYREGKVIFDRPVEGVIYADYMHDNFKVYKRNYENKSVRNERLVTRERQSFELEHKNITVMPAPKFYTGQEADISILHPSSYWVDYENGRVHFFEDIQTRVYADYSYFTEEELEYEDVNKNTGEIYLKDRISFRDEIYVSYLAQENTLEYKGYYDEELNKFIYLDLNPTSGHSFDYINEEDLDEGYSRHAEKMEGRELLDKEVFLYILPSKSTYYKKNIHNNIALRHVFHYKNWERIKEVNPEALLLGRVQVRENTNKENIIIMDARRPGGGLKEAIRDEDIERRIGYTSAFWDIGDFNGLAYYRNGVLIVEVPDKVLQSNGGDFSEDDVNEMLSKYMSYGVYPIVEYVKEAKEIMDRRGYFVVYEQPRDTLLIDEYTDLVSKNMTQEEKYYFITDQELHYEKTYESQFEEEALEYSMKFDSKNILIELYQDKDKSVLLGRQEVPVFATGNTHISSAGSGRIHTTLKGSE